MIRKDKRSSFGGKLGEEFNAIWSALIANQIIPADGMEVNQTSSGTVLKPKTTGDNTETIQQNSGVIQTRRITFESLGFGESTGSPSVPLEYKKEELFFIDDMGRIIAKPPIQDRDFPAGVASLRPTSAVFWGKNDLGQPTKLGGILTNPFDAPYNRDWSQAFLYPLIESLESNGGDWAISDASSSPTIAGRFNSFREQYNYTPTLITPIDPPIYLFMHPESGLGSILKVGTYMSTVDTTAGNFDTMIKPHISYAFDPLAIKCSYIDLNIEGRHWYNKSVPLDISHRH